MEYPRIIKEIIMGDMGDKDTLEDIIHTRPAEDTPLSRWIIKEITMDDVDIRGGREIGELREEPTRVKTQMAAVHAKKTMM